MLSHKLKLFGGFLVELDVGIRSCRAAIQSQLAEEMADSQLWMLKDLGVSPETPTCTMDDLDWLKQRG